MPQPLSTDELPARRRGISPAYGRAGLHRADQGRGVAFLDPGPAQNGACLVRKHPGPAPVAACDRHQRSFAQRERDILVRADFLPDADPIPEGLVAAIEVTAKDAPDPLQERGCRRHEALRREPPHRLVCVSAHLFDPAPAQEGPHHGGPRLGGRVTGPGRIPVLPAIDHVGPPLGLDRSPRQRAEQRGQSGRSRTSLSFMLRWRPRNGLPLHALPKSWIRSSAAIGSSRAGWPACALRRAAGCGGGARGPGLAGVSDFMPTA